MELPYTITIQITCEDSTIHGIAEKIENSLVNEPSVSYVDVDYELYKRFL